MPWYLTVRYHLQNFLLRQLVVNIKIDTSFVYLTLTVHLRYRVGIVEALGNLEQEPRLGIQSPNDVFLFDLGRLLFEPDNKISNYSLVGIIDVRTIGQELGHDLLELVLEVLNLTGFGNPRRELGSQEPNLAHTVLTHFYVLELLSPQRLTRLVHVFPRLVNYYNLNSDTIARH